MMPNRRSDSAAESASDTDASRRRRITDWDNIMKERMYLKAKQNRDGLLNNPLTSFPKTTTFVTYTPIKIQSG